MKRFKNILLFAPAEVTPAPAIERAAALARSNGARLTLVDVLPDDSEGPWMTLPGQADLERMLVVARREELEELAAPVREQEVEVETRVITGQPFVELIREVQRRGHDLVVKTAQGDAGGLGGLLGSTALHLMRKCPCPVWVVKPGGVTRRSVVAAIDPDLRRPTDDPLSRTVLELASSLARSGGLELEVVHAWWLRAESLLRSRRLGIAPERVEAMLAKSRAEAEKAVREALRPIDLTDLPHRVSVVRGVPFEVISNFTRHAEVAVLGTLSRSGIAGVLIGNTAERVLRQVDCSVFAVKPPGFESPIRLPAKELQMTA